MSRSKNPFPKTFLCTMWPKSEYPIKMRAEYVNGWYQLRVVNYCLWREHTSFRWSDIQRYIECGYLVIEDADDPVSDVPLDVDLSEVL